jgi:hypothetical protein
MMLKKISAIGSFALLAGCTTAMYEGAPRSDAELATIRSESIIIMAVDGRKVPFSGGNFAPLTLAPGERAITVQLNDVGNKRTASTYPAVVFDAKAGTRYRVKPKYAGRHWQAEVIDENSREVVSIPKP